MSENISFLHILLVKFVCRSLHLSYSSLLIAFNQSCLPFLFFCFFDWQLQLVCNKTSILSHYDFNSGIQQHSKMTFTLGYMAHYSEVIHVCLQFFLCFAFSQHHPIVCPYETLPTSHTHTSLA